MTARGLGFASRAERAAMIFEEGKTAEEPTVFFCCTTA